ncbi:TonB-dependent receptor [Sphingomonas sp.]|uniref:TonB-dependent receptor n=1 Tax=Sphingomonas sp. TaxID=28214 RepID=UPI003CC55E3B
MPLTLALILAAQTAPALTSDQTAPQAATERAGPALASPGGDVVVTARRRNESAQRVPIAISVIGGTALAETGTNNVTRLTQIQPTLQFYSTNPRNSAANIRGLGAPFGLTNDGIEQGVGIYVDQVYYARIASATFDFTDTDRIEVLRGPQGTLYGKNTTAGAINIYTRAPSFEPEARVELSAGNYGYVQGKASVSGPLIADTLAIRLSTSLTSRRGTIYNVRQGEWQNAQDNQSYRGRLLWRAAPSLTLTLAGDYNRQNPNCCVQYYARVGATQRPLSRQYAALAAAQNYAVPSTDLFARLTDVDSDLRAKQTLGGVSLLADWDLGGATMTSVSAWRVWNWDPSNDRDFIGLPITTVSQNPSQQHQVSQELRLASNGTHAVDWVAGAFYFHQTIDTQGSQVQGAAASAFLLNPTSAGGRNPATLNGLTATNTIGFGNTSAALFGKLTWHPTGRLSVSPGLRLNYDEKNGSYLSVVTNGTGTALTADQLGVLAPQSYAPRFHNWNLSGDLTVAYDWSADIHSYATYARSYKSGGINLSGLPLNATNTGVDLTAQTVRPEKVDHLELGLKTQLADRRITANLAVFYTGIDDYQATVNNGQLTVIRGYLANAGRVRTAGVELDSAFRPTARLNAYVNAAYTEAKYVRFRNAPCPPELSGGNPALNGATPAPAGTPGLSPLTCDISGQALPGVSKWALSWGAEYGLPVHDGQVYAAYDGSYRSRFSSNPSPSAYTYIDGYALANFRLGFRAGARLNAFAWVRNAFDRNYFELLAVQSGSTGLIVGQPGDPRTFGGTISTSF